MLAWFRKAAAHREPVVPKEAVASNLSQAMSGKCPRCHQSLREHSFQMFAMTVATADKKATISDFIRKAKSHDWESLLKYQDFDPLKNALEAFALRCADQELNMLFIRAPFELYEDRSLEDWEGLDESDSAEWLGYLEGEKWICFASGAEETPDYLR